MTLINLLLFILVGVGITNLVVNATILDNLRDFIIVRSSFLGKLVSCMMCSGFWIGALLSMFYSDIGLISGGAIISLLSYIFDSVTDYLDVLIAVKSNELEDEK